MTERFGEPIVPGLETVYEGRLVVREQTPYQRLEIFEHAFFGRVLVLDGLIQTTEWDEFFYHEMLVHPALTSITRPERVLIIGGGDGGTLRRVLEHGPSQVVMCEIDEAVTKRCLEHMPSISAGAFDDPRAQVVFDDGIAFAGREHDAYDAIIIDGSDPVGPAVGLFAESFFADCRRALRPGGILVTQAGSPAFGTGYLRDGANALAQVFTTVEIYTGIVPTYPGVAWSYLCATQGPPVASAPPEALAERLSARSIETRYYSPAVHAGAFAVPPCFNVLDAASRTAVSRG